VPYAPSAFTFITTGLTAALDRAEAAASGKNVLAHSPDVAQQLLRVGPARRDSASPVPVLLGAVRRQDALDQVVGLCPGGRGVVVGHCGSASSAAPTSWCNYAQSADGLSSTWVLIWRGAS
jgi:hypothetical protein